MAQTVCDNQTVIEEGREALLDEACMTFHNSALEFPQPSTPTAYNEATLLEWDDHQGAVLPFVPMMQVLALQPTSGEPEAANSSAGHASQQPLTVPTKELMKLRKKLREIEKIEKLIASGEAKIDTLQRAKVEKKADVISKIALAEAPVKEAELFNQEQVSSVATENMEIHWAPVLIPITFPTEGSSSQLPHSLEGQNDILPSMDFGTDDTEMQARHMAAAAQAQMHAQLLLAISHQEGQSQHAAASQLQDPQQSQPPYHASSEHPVLAPQMTPAELLTCLESDNERLGEVIAAIRGSVLSLSLESTGCRLVQLALQLADLQTAAELVAELWGHVHVAIKSPHGNYVIQQVIEVLPATQCNFIILELQGSGAAMARHRFGCRILCRLLEHCAEEAESLIQEVLAEALGLCRHNFGHHVIQSVVEHGTVEQHQKIIAALCTDLQQSLSNRNASYVIEKVLIYCAAREQDKIIDMLLASSSEVLAGALRGRLGPQLRKASRKLVSVASLKALDDIRMTTGRLPGSKQWKRSYKSVGHLAATAAAVAAS